MSVCEVRPASPRSIAAAGDKKMSTVLVSAAALVATVCAEAAEAAGADRSRVTSAVRTGLESRSPTELLILTATAATCLRATAALKLKADVRGISSSNSMSINTSIQKGATLRVCLPCDEVSAVSGDSGVKAVDGRGFFPVVLSTSAGTVQLLLDNQMHCQVWKASIEGMLSDRKLKHAKC